MGLTYFKRYRMEIDLGELPSGGSQLPAGYRFASWRDGLLREHARVKWQSFRNEIDANVFPCLGDRDGCLQLMRDIAGRHNFVPEATWLLQNFDPRLGTWTSVGTVQGVRNDHIEGSIQNLGIIPEYRSLGLGSALLYRALEGFEEVGCVRGQLEVTFQNSAAVRLYQRLGFRRVETVFKVAEVAVAY
jgi:hypothetical protein